MKAKELRERATPDLIELRNVLKKDLFSYRMKNHVGQLEDTSLLNKTRRDLARIELILHARGSAANEERSEACPRPSIPRPPRPPPRPRNPPSGKPTAVD